MNKVYIIIFLLLPLIFYGCSQPPISVLYLTDAKYSDYIVNIDNSTYFLEYEYDIGKFSQRIKDSLITYCEIENVNNNEYTFKKLSISDSTLLCYDEASIDSLKLSEIKFIKLFRASTSEERFEGWTQVICWSLIGFITDISSKKEGENLQFKGTGIGGIIGISLGSLFFFDNNKPYEDIYIKHN